MEGWPWPWHHRRGAERPLNICGRAWSNVSQRNAQKAPDCMRTSAGAVPGYYAKAFVENGVRVECGGTVGVRAAAPMRESFNLAALFGNRQPIFA